MRERVPTAVDREWIPVVLCFGLYVCHAVESAAVRMESINPEGGSVDETKSVKAEQKGKPRYEAPRLIALNGVASGEGGGEPVCGPGSSALDFCFSGSAAGFDCMPGTAVF